MEERTANIQINQAGGNASENAKNYRISLPTSWIKQLGIDENNRKVIIQFNGETITIQKEQFSKGNYKDFISQALENNHNIVILYLYNKNILCTKICADYTSKMVAVENEIDDILLTAFGVNNSPSWSDYTAFLIDRCVPRERDGLKFYLQELGLEEYNPLEIIRKTKGKMAEDMFWIKIVRG